MEFPWRKCMRFMIYTVEMILFFSLQQAPIGKVHGFAINPNLVLIIVLSIAFFEGEVAAMGFGLFAGVLMDFGAGLPLFVYTILLAVICFIAGHLTSNVIRTNILNMLLFSFAAIVLVYGVNFVFFYLMKGYPDVGYAFMYNYLPRMISTFIMSILFYFFNKSIAIIFREDAQDEI